MNHSRKVQGPPKLISAIRRANFKSIQSELTRIDQEAMTGEDTEIPQEWVDDWWDLFTTSNDWVN